MKTYKDCTFTCHLEWNKETGEERKLEVTYNFYPGTPNTYWEPGDPTELEVTKVMGPTWNEQTEEYDWDSLSATDQKKIEDWSLENAWGRMNHHDED